jgi:GC-rich sequence DNA-binding factor
MFKAKKAGTPAFRRRAVSDEDGSKEQAPTAAVDPPLSAALTAAQSKKLKRPKPSKAALSFGGDEEGEDAEVFTVKKRQQGVTAKKRSKAAPVALDDASAAAQAGSVTSSSWHSSTAGMYSAEGMAALRKSQPFQIAAANSGSAMDVADDEDFAAAEAGTEAVLTGDAAALAFETEADSAAAGPSSRSPTASSSSRNLALPLRSGEQRSSSSRDDGFIAFDDSMPVPGQASSRTSAARARAHAAAFAEDDDEELQQQWEAEQVQRGGGGGAGESQSRSLLQQQRSPQQQQLALAARGEAVTVEAMQKALRTSTAALRESVEQGARAASKLETELQAVTVSAEALQHSTAAAGALYEAFQRTRDALADLCGMLRAKQGMISEVAAARAALSAQRLRTVLQRRAGVYSARSVLSTVYYHHCNCIEFASMFYPRYVLLAM